jgi:hypothetical protein
MPSLLIFFQVLIYLSIYLPTYYLQKLPIYLPIIYQSYIFIYLPTYLLSEMPMPWNSFIWMSIHVPNFLFSLNSFLVNF